MTSKAFELRIHRVIDVPCLAAAMTGPGKIGEEVAVLCMKYYE